MSIGQAQPSRDLNILPMLVSFRPFLVGIYSEVKPFVSKELYLLNKSSCETVRAGIATGIVGRQATSFRAISSAWAIMCGLFFTSPGSSTPVPRTRQVIVYFPAIMAAISS